MYYFSGEGRLATEGEGIPFERGSIIIVPPGIVHGSVSEGGFVNISIGGDFNHLLMFEGPIKLQDNHRADGERLARLILENRYSDDDYLWALCTAYIRFLLQNTRCDNRIDQAVAKIISAITENFCDLDFNLAALLRQSGYAEDYIRAEFRRVTASTPVQFLTKMKIDHARRLLEIYGRSITVAEVAEACGFEDAVYFSKRFKQFTGVSPEAYKKQLVN
jgi:AraC-like DNA-binding protein